MDAGHRIYLASASPRRRELLRQIGIPHRNLSVHVDETVSADESPGDYVLRLALTKAWAGCRLRPAGDHRAVLGADTAVVAAGVILGKPCDEQDALTMLRRLSGDTHHVYTGVALVDGIRESTRLSVSTVSFRLLTERECRDYLAAGEASDKAGAYAIQGRAAMFVSRLEGSYSGVVGLPLFETAELLREFSIDLGMYSCPD